MRACLQCPKYERFGGELNVVSLMGKSNELEKENFFRKQYNEILLECDVKMHFGFVFLELIFNRVSHLIVTLD